MEWTTPMSIVWIVISRTINVTKVGSSIIEEMYYIRIKLKRIENYKRVTPVNAIFSKAGY